MNILGLTKTTLLDYPGKIASTIFIGNCNLLCPFCHNRSLVIQNSNPSLSLDINYALEYLDKRKNILEGVCITGGEPTLSNNLVKLIQDIKKLGLLIKLDTNGTNPHILHDLIDSNLIDYIAMDIKNSPDKYFLTSGTSNFDITNIYKSIDLIMSSSITYEFRTTVVKEFHTLEDMTKIGQMISQSNQYFIQNFRVSDNQIKKGFTCHDLNTLITFKNELNNYVKKVEIRGI